MQAGRRRRHRAALRRVHRLVALGVDGGVAAPDVRRQGNVPHAVDRLVDGGAVLGPQADGAAAVEPAGEHLPAQPAPAALEDDARAGAKPLPGMHEGVPAPVAARGQEQALDRSPARHPPAQQPRGDHPRVVDDEQIARREEGGKRPDGVVPEAAGGPVEDEQAGRLALGRRGLGDSVGGEVEVEVGDAHGGGATVGRVGSFADAKPRLSQTASGPSRHDLRAWTWVLRPAIVDESEHPCPNSGRDDALVGCPRADLAAPFADFRRQPLRTWGAPWAAFLQDSPLVVCPKNDFTVQPPWARRRCPRLAPVNRGLSALSTTAVRCKAISRTHH